MLLGSQKSLILKIFEKYKVPCGEEEVESIITSHRNNQVTGIVNSPRKENYH
jgi:hypothetical protein